MLPDMDEVDPTSNIGKVLGFLLDPTLAMPTALVIRAGAKALQDDFPNAVLLCESGIRSYINELRRRPFLVVPSIPLQLARFCSFIKGAAYIRDTEAGHTYPGPFEAATQELNDEAIEVLCAHNMYSYLDLSVKEYVHLFAKSGGPYSSVWMALHELLTIVLSSLHSALFNGRVDVSSVTRVPPSHG